MWEAFEIMFENTTHWFRQKFLDLFDFCVYVFLKVFLYVLAWPFTSLFGGWENALWFTEKLRRTAYHILAMLFDIRMDRHGRIMVHWFLVFAPTLSAMFLGELWRRWTAKPTCLDPTYHRMEKEVVELRRRVEEKDEQMAVLKAELGEERKRCVYLEKTHTMIVHDVARGSAVHGKTDSVVDNVTVSDEDGNETEELGSDTDELDSDTDEEGDRDEEGDTDEECDGIEDVDNDSEEDGNKRMSANKADSVLDHAEDRKAFRRGSGTVLSSNTTWSIVEEAEKGEDLVVGSAAIALAEGPADADASSTGADSMTSEVRKRGTASEKQSEV